MYIGNKTKYTNNAELKILYLRLTLIMDNIETSLFHHSVLVDLSGSMMMH